TRPDGDAVVPESGRVGGGLEPVGRTVTGRVVAPPPRRSENPLRSGADGGAAPRLRPSRSRTDNTEPFLPNPVRVAAPNGAAAVFIHRPPRPPACKKTPRFPAARRGLPRNDRSRPTGPPSGLRTRPHARRRRGHAHGGTRRRKRWFRFGGEADTV